MSDQAETVERRIFVGGLFPEVQSSDLRDKFSRFGNVDEIQIKVRKDEKGTPVKTFAYLNITGNKKDFDKCFSTFNRAKWKGSMLILQNAKESFLTKLEKERTDPDVPVSPRVKDTPPLPHDPLAQVPGVKDFVMRGAVPGTPIPGEKNWVVGKYGRIMPIVHLKKSDKKKIVRVDPSKLCHNLKRLKDTTDQEEDIDVDSLTWNIQGEDKEITRKRKGEFIETPNKNKSVRTGSKAQMVMEFLADRERRFAAVVKDANDFEIVQRDGAVKKNADNSRSSKTPWKQMAKKSSVVSKLKNSTKDISSDSDRGSADTDEIIASTKSSAQKKSYVAHQASQNFIENHSELSSDSESESGDEESSSFVFIPGKKAALKKVLSLPSASPSRKLETSEKKKIKSRGIFEEKCAGKIVDKPKDGNKKVEVSDSEDTEESDLEEADVNGFELDSEDDSDGSASSDDSSTSDTDSDSAKHKSNMKAKQTGKKRILELPEFKGRALLDDDAIMKSPLSTHKPLSIKSTKVVANSSSTSDDESSDEGMSSSDNKKKSTGKACSNFDSTSSKALSVGKKGQTGDMDSVDSSSDDTSSDDDKKHMQIPSEKMLKPDSVLKGLKSSKKKQDEIENSDDSSSDGTSSDDDKDMKLAAKSSKPDCVSRDLKSSKYKQERSDDSDNTSDDSSSDDDESAKPTAKSLKPDSSVKGFKVSKNKQERSDNSDDSSSDDASSDDNNVEKALSKSLKESDDSDNTSSDEDMSSGEKETKATNSSKSKSIARPTLNQMDDKSSDSADSADTDEILATLKKSSTQSTRTPIPAARKSIGSVMDEFSCGFVINDDKIVYPDNDSSDSDSDDSRDDIPVKKMKDSKSNKDNSSSKGEKLRQTKRDKDKKSVIDERKGNDLKETEGGKNFKENKLAEKERNFNENVKKEKQGKTAERLSPFDKHVDDNRRRLETLKERSRELENKKALVQQALAQVDTGSRLNKKIVFDSDEDWEEAGTLTVEGTRNTTQIEEETTDLPKKKKQLTLFDSSGSENSDSDSSDEDRFRIRPQYEGEKGKKLMKLQSRFGNDERFRIDERFVESEDEDNDHKDVVPDEDGENERSRTLRILEGVVGRQPVARLLKQESQRKTFKDTTALHFDPTIEEHSQFEIKAEAKEKAPKKKNKKKKKEEEEVKEEEMPEVSKERSYEVTSVLQDAFKSQEDKSSGFSLLAAFGKRDQEVDMETDEGTMQSIPRSSGMMNPWESRFRVDSSDESVSSEDEPETKQSLEKAKSSEKAVLFPVRKTTFFFSEDDDRLDEGVTFFRRPEDFDAVVERWRENRPKLVESYKEKLRKAVKNRRKLQLQKTILRRNAQRGVGRRRTEES